MTGSPHEENPVEQQAGQGGHLAGKLSNDKGDPGKQPGEEGDTQTSPDTRELLKKESSEVDDIPSGDGIESLRIDLTPRLARPEDPVTRQAADILKQSRVVIVHGRLGVSFLAGSDSSSGSESYHFEIPKYLAADWAEWVSTQRRPREFSLAALRSKLEGAKPSTAFVLEMNVGDWPDMPPRDVILNDKEELRRLLQKHDAYLIVLIEVGDGDIPDDVRTGPLAGEVPWIPLIARDLTGRRFERERGDIASRISAFVERSDVSENIFCSGLSVFSPVARTIDGLKEELSTELDRIEGETRLPPEASPYNYDISNAITEVAIVAATFLREPARTTFDALCAELLPEGNVPIEMLPRHRQPKQGGPLGTTDLMTRGMSWSSLTQTAYAPEITWRQSWMEDADCYRQDLRIFIAKRNGKIKTFLQAAAAELLRSRPARLQIIFNRILDRCLPVHPSKKIADAASELLVALALSLRLIEESAHLADWLRRLIDKEFVTPPKDVKTKMDLENARHANRNNYRLSVRLAHLLTAEIAPLSTEDSVKFAPEALSTLQRWYGNEDPRSTIVAGIVMEVVGRGADVDKKYISIIRDMTNYVSGELYNEIYDDISWRFKHIYRDSKKQNDPGPALAAMVLFAEWAPRRNRIAEHIQRGEGLALDILSWGFSEEILGGEPRPYDLSYRKNWLAAAAFGGAQQQVSQISKCLGVLRISDLALLSTEYTKKDRLTQILGDVFLVTIQGCARPDSKLIEENLDKFVFCFFSTLLGEFITAEASEQPDHQLESQRFRARVPGRIVAQTGSTVAARMPGVIIANSARGFGALMPGQIVPEETPPNGAGAQAAQLARDRSFSEVASGGSHPQRQDDSADLSPDDADGAAAVDYDIVLHAMLHMAEQIKARVENKLDDFAMLAVLLRQARNQAHNPDYVGLQSRRYLRKIDLFHAALIGEWFFIRFGLSDTRLSEEDRERLTAFARELSNAAPDLVEQLPSSFEMLADIVASFSSPLAEIRARDSTMKLFETKQKKFRSLAIFFKSRLQDMNGREATA